MMNFSESPLGIGYQKFCRIRKTSLNQGLINLTDERWFYPTKLLPLALFINETNMRVNYPQDEAASTYLNVITGRGIKTARGTYMLVIEIPTDKNKRDRMFEPLENVEERLIGGKDAFFYLIQELVDNVYEHSKFSKGYVMAQRYKTKKFFEICIADNGISIPGSFEKAGYNFEDGKALFEAIEGLSTKHEGERGYGLGSSLKLLTQGLKGQCLIVSRNGGLLADENSKTFYKMDSSTAFKGTLISVRAQFQSKKVDIYDYVQ